MCWSNIQDSITNIISKQNLKKYQLYDGFAVPHEELQSLQYLFSQHLLGHKPENLCKLAM
jgi:hypothetical protein